MKGSETNIMATTMPAGVKAMRKPSGVSRSAEPAMRRVERGKGNARNGGGQREWQVDQGVGDAAAGKTVTGQHPGHQQAEHSIDAAGEHALERLTRRSASTRGRVTMAKKPCQPRLAVNQSMTASGPTTITQSQMSVMVRLGANPGRMLGLPPG